MRTVLRTSAAVCLAVWTAAVSTAPVVEGTSAAPQAPVQPATQAAAQAFPQADIDKGRATVTQVCVGCHDGGAIGRMVAVRKKTADEWRDTVYRMIGRGAQVLPDEIEPLTAYLTVAGGQGRAAATSATQSAAPAEGGGRRGRPAAAGDAAAGGDATAILAQRCQLCHDLAMATTKPATTESWASIVDRMVKLGAPVTPAEHQTLIEYLNARPQ
jgi:cytochrome c5